METTNQGPTRKLCVHSAHTSSCCYVTYLPYYWCHWMGTVNWNRFNYRRRRRRRRNATRPSNWILYGFVPIEHFWWKNLIFLLNLARLSFHQPNRRRHFAEEKTRWMAVRCTAHALRMELEKFTFQWHNYTFGFPPKELFVLIALNRRLYASVVWTLISSAVGDNRFWI